MSNIEQAARRFVRTVLARDKAEFELDGKVVEALNGNHTTSDDSRTFISSWLNKYSVLQGFTTEKRRQIVENVLRYAADKGSGRSTSIRMENLVELQEKFDQLESYLRNGVELRNKGGTTRRIESLNSKLLWCCYPESVPILDKQAESSLAILSKLMELRPPTAQTRYGKFCEVWMQAYRPLQIVFADEDLGLCRYKVRAFDRFLWWLSEPQDTAEQ